MVGRNHLSNLLPLFFSDLKVTTPNPIRGSILSPPKILGFSYFFIIPSFLPSFHYTKIASFRKNGED